MMPCQSLMLEGICIALSATATTQSREAAPKYSMDMGVDIAI